MTVNKKKLYTWVMLLLILSQAYNSSFRLNIVVQVAALGLYLATERIAVSRLLMRNLLPFIYLMVIGFVGTLLFRYEVLDVIKDIFHFLKPIVGLLIGYLYFRKIDDIGVFVKTVIKAGVISAVIHVLIIVFLVKDFTMIEKIRYYTKDNFLELFSLFFLLYYKRFWHGAVFRKPKYARFFILLLLFSCFLYFSRMMIIMAILLALSVAGYTRITRQTIKIIGAVAATVVLLYVYLYNANIRRGQEGFEGFLYKIKIAPEEIFETRIDRDNHADLWDHWRGYEAKRAFALIKERPATLLFGTGHGSLVNLKFYAPLSDDSKGMKYISELHNGYVYIFYKTGLVGLIIYLGFLLRLYLFIYIEKNFLAALISGIGVIYILSTLSITGAYNNRDNIIVILGALLYFYKRPAMAEIKAVA